MYEVALKSKALRGFGWSFVEAIGMRTVQFVVGVILARLLLPEQFGLIGMLSIFIAVAQTFLDSGFGASLIQRPVVSDRDTSSIFYFNLLVGIAATSGLYFLAPFVANFYSQSILTPLLRLMSLLLVINSLGLVQTVLLTKEIDFKTQTKVTIIASVLSGSLGIYMAYHGYGVWSLAVQQIAGAGVRVILLWVLSTWRPKWVFSMQSLREMFGFGSKLLVSGLLNTFFENIYLIFIGKFFSASDLGYYSRANTLQQLPSQTLSGLVSRVVFPVFSSIQHDREWIKRGMKKVLTTLVLVNFPMLIGLAVVAQPLVLLLLTDKWLPCVPFLQLLCLVGLMYPLHLINLNALQAIGRSDLFLRLEIIKKVLVVLNIAITWHWGIITMISGQVLASTVSYYLNAYYNKKLLNYPIREQICDLFPYLANTMVMGGVAYSLSYLKFNTPLQLLASQVMAGVVIYLLLCWVFRLRAFLELQAALFCQFQCIFVRDKRR